MTVIASVKVAAEQRGRSTLCPVDTVVADIFMTNNTISKRSIDRVVSGLVLAALMLSSAMLIASSLRGENLGAWVWERHQNQFSWYSRPLFIIPACYYAYRHNLRLSIGFLLLIGCSLFWFDAPDVVPQHVVGYLEWEKQLFYSGESALPLLSLVAAVMLFLSGLICAFWQRNAWMGLLLINAGTIMKIVVSVCIGNEAGMAAIVPSVSSLACINFLAYVVWRRYQRRH